jgi:putative phosphoribosyl transferase
VVSLLQRADRLSIPLSDASLSGDVGEQQSAMVPLEEMLDAPANAIGLILFAHGSGSSRHSPRSLYVAEVLRSHGMATLLFDLLTPEEEELDRRTSAYRSDIGLLAQRLVSAVRWVRQELRTRNLPKGLFGVSTGAAAALVAAARLPNLIASVVSRGGRPDLAGEYLSQVRASVLLLVGSKDEMVLGLNRYAFENVHCKHKQLSLVPGATHLFEEPRAVEKIAVAAADWFASHMNSEGIK